MLAGLNWAAASGRRGAWPVAAAAAAGAALAAAAWAMMARATAGLPVRGAGDPRVALALLLAAAPPGLTVALRRMARGWNGEVVGWGDVLLAGVMGLWFGIRLVWAPLGIGIGAAAAMGSGEVGGCGMDAAAAPVAAGGAADRFRAARRRRAGGRACHAFVGRGAAEAAGAPLPARGETG